MTFQTQRQKSYPITILVTPPVLSHPVNLEEVAPQVVRYSNIVVDLERSNLFFRCTSCGFRTSTGPMSKEFRNDVMHHGNSLPKGEYLQHETPPWYQLLVSKLPKVLFCNPFTIHPELFFNPFFRQSLSDHLLQLSCRERLRLRYCLTHRFL